MTLRSLSTLLLGLLLSALLGSTAAADKYDISHLTDGGVKDFGQAQKPYRAEFWNLTGAPITVKWFDMRAGKWCEQTLQKGQKWIVNLRQGEYLKVEDVVDHSSSKFGYRLSE